MANSLKITTGDTEFSLEGDVEYVERAYAAVRELMLERFVEAIHAQPEEPPKLRQTMPMAQVMEDHPHMSVITCNEVYHKIHLVDREVLENSDFSRAIEFKGVARVYINRDQQDHFREYFPFGKVLWRELTSAGRNAIRQTK